MRRSGSPVQTLTEAGWTTTAIAQALSDVGYCSAHAPACCERANSMRPCTAGSCGPTRRNWNAFNSPISARLGTIFATGGLTERNPPQATVASARGARQVCLGLSPLALAC